MKIMKKYLLLASALAVMVGCADDSIVNNGIETPVNGELRPITFGSYTAATTRADFEGGAAAALLNNNFVVEGVKSNGTIASQEIVYDHYNVNWVANTANTTTSNTADWEYVGQAGHAYGPAGTQAIKYWDYAKTQYDFIAYSVGLATANYTSTYDNTKVQISEIDPSKMNGVDSDTDGKIDQGAYTIKGKASELAKFYIADLVTAYRDPVATGDYQNTVQFKFRSLSAKVRIALYEIVPGYSVKDVVFYSDASTKATPTPPATWGTAHLFTTGSDVFNEEGTYTVYYPTTGSTNKTATDYNKAHLSFEAVTGGSGTATDKTFGALTGSLAANNLAAAENAEAVGNLYLGRSSNTAIYAGDKTKNYYTVVIPNETPTALNLKVDYTLVSTDGSGEAIHVTGATATVPAVYGSWKSGYAYTYLFKISQNSNGKTNPSVGPEGLYPITFDAVVMNDEVDGIQETITTVADPSITTYAKGEMVTKNNEYLTGANIYVVVENGTALTVGTNANLYTVTLTDGDTTDGITTACQTINEASIANALAKGGTVTDANKFVMTVTAAAGLTAVSEIAAADAPDGNAIAINGAKFTPAEPTFTAVADANLTIGKTYYTDDQGAGKFVATTAADASGYYEKTATKAGTYVFEFISRDKATGTYVSGTTYYTAGTGDTTVNTSGFTAGTTDVSSYYVGDPKKHYKIIKVVDKY